MSKIPWWHQGTTSTSNPFSSLGTDWCRHCKMEVDCDTKAEHVGTTFTWKRWCNRCGRVTQSGIYDQVCILTNTPLPQAAIEWTREGGMDRR